MMVMSPHTEHKANPNLRCLMIIFSACMRIFTSFFLELSMASNMRACVLTTYALHEYTSVAIRHRGFAHHVWLNCVYNICTSFTIPVYRTSNFFTMWTFVCSCKNEKEKFFLEFIARFSKSVFWFRKVEENYISKLGRKTHSVVSISPYFLHKPEL